MFSFLNVSKFFSCVVIISLALMMFGQHVTERTKVNTSTNNAREVKTNLAQETTISVANSLAHPQKITTTATEAYTCDNKPALTTKLDFNRLFTCSSLVVTIATLVHTNISVIEAPATRAIVYVERPEVTIQNETFTAGAIKLTTLTPTPAYTLHKSGEYSQPRHLFNTPSTKIIHKNYKQLSQALLTVWQC
jgi:hypothetical protein